MNTPTGIKVFFYFSLALDFRPGTKTFIDPGSDGSRDKCGGPKPCSVVVVGWVSSIAIELDKMLPFDASLADTTFLVGFAEGVGVIFVRVGDGVFTIDLQSCKVNKVYEGPIITCVVPYISFCTPGASCRQLTLHTNSVEVHVRRMF